MVPPPDCQPEAGLKIKALSYLIIQTQEQFAFSKLSQVVG